MTKWNISSSDRRDALTYGIKFKATNLLDSQVEITQAGHTIFFMKPGREYALTLSVQY